jgi:hypothetical protein
VRKTSVEKVREIKMSTSWLLIVVVLLWSNATMTCAATADLEWVRVADDGKGFVLSDLGRPFVPWEFNYDHEKMPPAGPASIGARHRMRFARRRQFPKL